MKRQQQRQRHSKSSHGKGYSANRNGDAPFRVQKGSNLSRSATKSKSRQLPTPPSTMWCLTSMMVVLSVWCYCLMGTVAVGHTQTQSSLASDSLRLDISRTLLLSPLSQFKSVKGRRQFLPPPTPSSASTASLIERMRGGATPRPLSDEIENCNSDDDNNTIMKKIRNVIRSIMDVTETKSPTLNKCLRSCLRTIEKLTGLKLLPRLLSSPSSSPSSKTKKNKKKKSKVKQDMVRDEDGDQKEQEKASDESVSKSKSKPKPKPQAVSHTTKEHLTSSITKSNPNHRIQKELKEFIKHPPDNLSVQVGKNIRIWIITIKGAKGSIYEGETFKLRVSFPKEYPTVPPSVYFLKGYIPKHEHVYTNGDICLSLLGKDWRPIMTAQSIAVSIQSILSSATKKTLPMDNAQHANAKPGEYQKDWVYHDDQC